MAALVSDLPRVWHNPRTPARDRKRMLRLLVEDVTLLRDDVIRLSIRWRGGATRQLECPLPLSAPDLRRTPAAVVEQVRALATEQTDAQVAETLNRRWLRTGDRPALSATRPPASSGSRAIEQKVRERHTPKRHPQVAQVGEVERRFPTRDRSLLEVHLAVGTVLHPPLAGLPAPTPLGSMSQLTQCPTLGWRGGAARPLRTPGVARPCHVGSAIFTAESVLKVLPCHAAAGVPGGRGNGLPTSGQPR